MSALKTTEHLELVAECERLRARVVEMAAEAMRWRGEWGHLVSENGILRNELRRADDANYENGRLRARVAGLESEQRWRPVPGPEMPEMLEYVLVTVQGEERKYIDIAYLHLNSEWGTIGCELVIAWRPLPEPWQGETEVQG